MRPLFGDWAAVRARLRASRALAVFCDFDGTLAPIRPLPEMVHPDRAMRGAIAKLAATARVRVSVVSARRREDVCTRLGVPGVTYFGLYGCEREGSTLAPSPAIRCMRQALSELPAGVWIEDKQYAIAVHYRGAGDRERIAAAERLRRALADWRMRVRVLPGKCVWELVPREFGDKGSAVRRELRAMPPGTLAVYVGDDRSDEAAFAAARGGITVRVGGSRLTRAQYSVNSVGEVRRLLEWIARERR